MLASTNLVWESLEFLSCLSSTRIEALPPVSESARARLDLAAAKAAATAALGGVKGADEKARSDLEDERSHNGHRCADDGHHQFHTRPYT